MTINEIPEFRLYNQAIEPAFPATPKEIVSRMGAMQAQDYAMAKWAVGKRMASATDEKVEEAVNDGDIIRTHLLRPTWHFVSSADIYWMLALTAPRIKASMKARNRELELTQGVLTICFDLIEKAMAGGKHLTREQLKCILQSENIKTDDNRLSHILMEAELEGIVCSGRKTGNKLTYALLSERVPHRKILTRDDSLATLAGRYFKSHGPATVKDFAWWSGLGAADVRKALELAKTSLMSESIGDEQYWFSETSGHERNDDSVHLLPAFDEFLISYKDRTSSLSQTHNRKAVSDNGIFRPLIVINGRVAGLWKRISKKDKVLIATGFFYPPTPFQMKLVEKEVQAYGTFMGKRIEMEEYEI